MKRFFAALLCLCLLAGCGQMGGTGDSGQPDGSGDGDAFGNLETFRIIREKDGGLLLAKQEGGPGEVYTMSLEDTALTLNGEPFDRSEPGAYQALPGDSLAGALAEIACGDVLETYPGQLTNITAVNLRSDGFDDRCALYLRVLNDLWDTDGALNSSITMISVNLSETSLSESEQAAVAWAFGGEHGISEVLTLSYQELAAEGYLTGTEPGAENLPRWEDGCLFSVTERETGDDELNSAGNTVTFDAQKWRSGLGAYFFCDCTSQQTLDGHWDGYTVGSEAIS